jgi:S1-C subfamily serine protease
MPSIRFPVTAATLAMLGLGCLAERLPAQEVPELRELAHLQESFQNAAERIAHSVVQVYATRTGEAPTRSGPRSGALYQRPDAPVSGVIVGENGLILTSNWNLAEGASAFRVTLPDGRSFEAERLGLDEVRDLALLKIDATGLPAADLSPSLEIEVGQWALVVGRSQRVDHHTLTTGIVSAASRFDDSAFQLDARTNYGSAGGAIVDIRGRLIGIVSRVVARNNRGQNSGIGFGTPISLVRRYLPDYRASKVFRQPRPPYLGIQADQGALDIEGVKIAQVILGTGAEAAGLAEGDIITSFGGAKIAEFQDLVREIRKLGVGSEVEIKFLRAGEEKTVTAKIGERPVGQ